jgi:peptidoglycan/xylan/chitin deacetylase (PgdA/CDA1 family)
MILPSMVLIMLRKIVKRTMSLLKQRDVAPESLPNGMYCLNYHRIGDKTDTQYDENVFSCNKESFELQLTYFSDFFHLISLSEALEIIKTKKTCTQRYLLLTFDDGYADNFTEAYPLLKKHNIPAVFFIATDYVESNLVPWWDQVAYMVNNSCKKTLSLQFMGRETIILKDRVRATKSILKHIKVETKLTIEDVLFNLKKETGVSFVPSNADGKSLFMTWAMIKEASMNGIDIGSHTCSHQLLSNLSFPDQIAELRLSKELLEKKTGKPILSLAYPVGSSSSYNYETCVAASESNYEVAFDFEKGVNVNPSLNKMELKRFPVNYDHLPTDIVTMMGSYKPILF